VAVAHEDDGLVECAKLRVPVSFQLSELIVVRAEYRPLRISRELEVVAELAGKQCVRLEFMHHGLISLIPASVVPLLRAAPPANASGGQQDVGGMNRSSLTAKIR